ncbi:MAG: NlpC/P60 family protein [Bacillota bacterium]
MRLLAACLGLALVLTAAVSASAPWLAPGSRGSQVSHLQLSLLRLGFSPGPVDGIYGPLTTGAVREFQAFWGLQPDGIAGPLTRQALSEALAAFPAHRQGHPGRNRITALTETALSFLGARYRWGGTGPWTFDCSGFVQHVFALHGMDIGRTSFVQYRTGVPVSISQAAPGDLVFFSTYAAGPSHVGVYLGDGAFIHCSSTRGGVVVTLLSEYAYKPLGFVRMF